MSSFTSSSSSSNTSNHNAMATSFDSTSNSGFFVESSSSTTTTSTANNNNNYNSLSQVEDVYALLIAISALNRRVLDITTSVSSGYNTHTSNISGGSSSSGDVNEIRSRSSPLLSIAGSEELEANIADVLIYQRRIKHYCDVIRLFPMVARKERNWKIYWRVSSAAQEYFKEFYLNNCIASIDPVTTMVGCVVLAGKIENCMLNIVDVIYLLSKCIQQLNESNKQRQAQGGMLTDVFEVPAIGVDSERKVVESELRILKSLEYNIDLILPDALVRSLVEDYRSCCKRLTVSSSDEILGKWVMSSCVYLGGSFSTLALKPTISAICALMAHEPTSLDLSFDRYLSLKFSKTSTSTSSFDGDENVDLVRELRVIYASVQNKFISIH